MQVAIFCLFSFCATAQHVVSNTEKNRTQVNFIVKFKDVSTHNALFQTPETNKVLAKIATNPNMQAMHSKKLAKLNMPTNIDKPLGKSRLQALSNAANAKIEHIRSLALGNDLIKITPLTSKKPEQLAFELMQTGAFEYVNLEHRYTNQSVDTSLFNDEHYSSQNYFADFSYVNPIGKGIEYVKKNQVNNLGRKLRIAVIDSGMLPHEDVDFISGYDFVTLENNHPDGTEYAKERDADPTDMVVFNDGTSCSNGHGLAISSLIAAKGNNHVGIVGTAPSTEVEIIPIRALGCSHGITTDIFEGLLWAAGESIPGVPDIEKPADVINMSLGSSSLIGCTEYEQEAFDKLKEKGITVVIAAGNANKNVRNTSPASCANIISVGAVNEKGDKAGYSNFGERVDLSAMGNVYGAGKGSEEAYSFTTGTSNAAPIITGIIANLKLKYPSLTPTQIESILKATANKINDNICIEKGCGAGIVNARKAFAAIDNIFDTNNYKLVHPYQGYETEADKAWINEMNLFVDACNLTKYTWGEIGSALEGISYKLSISENNGIFKEFEQVSIPQKTIALPDTTVLAFQVCINSECGDLQAMPAVDIQKPSVCNSL